MDYEKFDTPVNKLAALGAVSRDEWIGQSFSPMPYHKFKALCKSKRYRDRTKDLTHSERMDLLAVELGAKDFSQYRDFMIRRGTWKFKNGEARIG